MIGRVPVPVRDGILDPEVCQRVVNARDARFDGLFFVGITTTRIYCRPICPARVTHPERRRFFRSAAEAERDGYRPCLRCRPELAPGRALCDAVPRLARAAAYRITAGALNGTSVSSLARELCVSERHLRRALEREFGVSPLQLAETHRLHLAKQLLTDTRLSVTRVAFASGFQSLRRFNSSFRAHYRMPPTKLRRARPMRGVRQLDAGMIRVTLAYRPPFAWPALLDCLRRNVMPEVEIVAGNRYGRTVEIDGCSGILLIEDAGVANGNGPRRPEHDRNTHVNVEVSVSLLPVLMPLLARVRHLLDLDAEPSAIDAHLIDSGLESLVPVRRGLRIPGTIHGFEAVLGVLLSGRPFPTAGTFATARRVACRFGESIVTGVSGLTRISPAASRIADASPDALVEVGVPMNRASAIHRIARALADDELCLERASDPETAMHQLVDVCGIPDRLATLILMRALHWPDTFPGSDRTLQRAAGVSSANALQLLAERWRPWRRYAALHLYRHTVTSHPDSHN